MDVAPSASERVGLGVALLLLACVVGASFVGRVQWIDGISPYPHHLDERFLAKPALRILQTGDLDPAFFRYPSLPIYLASAGMGVGAAISIARGEIASVAEIESAGRPYYAPPIVMRVPRLVHAAIASATLLLVAAIGYRLRRAPAMLVLGPAVLAVNSYYHEEGWLYLNVDMVTAFFALATTLQILRAVDRPTFRSLVVGPALLCGATIASKYPSGLILAPAALAVYGCAPPERRVRWIGALFVGSGLAFVLFCPYSLLSADVFVSDVLREVRHYATGRKLHEADRGVEQVVFYGKHLLETTGSLLIVLAGVGTVALARSSPRRVLLLGLFPAALFLLLTLQRVHFHRNLVPAYGMLAVASSLGIHAVYTFFAARLDFVGHPRIVRALCATAVVLGVAASVPAKNLAALRPDTDSRNTATTWMRENLAPTTTLLVPGMVRFAGYGLPETFALVRSTNPNERLLLPRSDCYLLVPEFRPSPGNEKAVERASRWNAWIERHSAGDAPLARFGRSAVDRGATWGYRMQLRVLRCRP